MLEAFAAGGGWPQDIDVGRPVTTGPNSARVERFNHQGSRES